MKLNVCWNLFQKILHRLLYSWHLLLLGTGSVFVSLWHDLICSFRYYFLKCFKVDLVLWIMDLMTPSLWRMAQPALPVSIIIYLVLEASWKLLLKTRSLPAVGDMNWFQNPELLCDNTAFKTFLVQWWSASWVWTLLDQYGYRLPHRATFVAD